MISDQDSASSISSSSDPDSDEAGLADNDRPRPRRTNFQDVVASIFEHIRSLYELSALLRRPSVPNKYIRSISKDQGISHFTYWDQAHVQNKFRDAEAYLVRRLGLANTRRRQQLKYWERYPDTSESYKPQAMLHPQRTSQSLLEFRPKSLTGPQPHQLAGEPVITTKPSQSLGSPSQTTRQSFSTVALSAINDDEVSAGRARTVYEPSAQSGACSLRVPDLIKVSEGASSFSCPFCFVTLDLQRMQKRHLWK